MLFEFVLPPSLASIHKPRWHLLDMRHLQRSFIYALLVLLTGVRADTSVKADSLTSRLQRLDSEMYRHTVEFLKEEKAEHQDEAQAENEAFFGDRDKPSIFAAKERAKQEKEAAEKLYIEANAESNEARELQAEAQTGTGQHNQSSLESGSFAVVLFLVATAMIVAFGFRWTKFHQMVLDSDIVAFKESLLDSSHEETITVSIDGFNPIPSKRLGPEDDMKVKIVQDLPKEPPSPEIKFAVETPCLSPEAENRCINDADGKPLPPAFCEVQHERERALRGSTDTEQEILPAAYDQGAARSDSGSTESGDATDFSDEKSNGTSQASRKATFSLTFNRKMEYDEEIRVVGNVGVLGHWDPRCAAPMRCTGGNVWVATVDLAIPSTGSDEPVEYKYVLMLRGQAKGWEQCANRTLGQSPPGSTLVSHNIWGSHGGT